MSLCHRQSRFCIILARVYIQLKSSPNGYSFGKWRIKTRLVASSVVTLLFGNQMCTYFTKKMLSDLKIYKFKYATINDVTIRIFVTYSISHSVTYSITYIPNCMTYIFMIIPRLSQIVFNIFCLIFCLNNRIIME